MPDTTQTIVTATTAIFLFEAAVDYLKDKIEDYSKDEQEEMINIREAYHTYCYPLEKSGSLTTLLPEDQKTSEPEKLNYPVHFQMDDKKPALFTRRFRPCKDVSLWQEKADPDSDFLSAINEMLARICEYQYWRDKRFFAKQRGYNYDPTNLFFEEFKSWLLMLSTASPNAETLKKVQVRITYLERLLNKHVFKSGDSLPTRETTILALKQGLQKTVVAMTTAFNRQTSARESFDKLKKGTESLVRNATQFLFYVFRNTKDLSENFMIEEIRQPKLEGYKQAHDTISGRLMQQLVLTPSYVSVIPIWDDSNIEPLKDDLHQNIFLDKENKLKIEFEDKNVSVENWCYYSKMESGILEPFKTPELMHDFLQLHGFIQKICIFNLICLRLYILAGHGGNLLVYEKAIEKVNIAINTFLKLINDMQLKIDQFYQSAEKLRDLIINDNKADESMKQWRTHFDSILYAKTSFSENKEICTDILSKIQNTMTAVNNKDYKKEVEEELNYFYKLVDNFANITSLSSSAASNNASIGENRSSFFAPAPINIKGCEIESSFDYLVKTYPRTSMLLSNTMTFCVLAALYYYSKGNSAPNSIPPPPPPGPK